MRPVGLRAVTLAANASNSLAAMPDSVLIRTIREDDFQAWQPLWDGYNAFYGRKEAAALAPEITQALWRRFFDPSEPVFALVAERDDGLAGLVHFLFHRSTTRVEMTCYLQDLFTVHARRGQGIGGALIRGVYEHASGHGIRRVYWQTHESNQAGRRLYDQVAKHSGFIVYSHDL